MFFCIYCKQQCSLVSDYWRGVFLNTYLME